MSFRTSCVGNVRRGEEKTCTACKAASISFLGHPLARPGAFPRNDMRFFNLMSFRTSCVGIARRGEEKTCTTCKAGRISFLGHPLARPGAFPRNDMAVCAISPWLEGKNRSLQRFPDKGSKILV